MISLFSQLPPAPVDPIFAVAEKAKQAGSGAIDATIGMILDEDGQPSVLPCVRKAAEEYARSFASGSFAYPPLPGVPAFRSAVKRLIFGDHPPLVASVAATGGTGAVFLNLKLLRLLGITDVILPVPSWPNHRRLLTSLGFTVREVPYLPDGHPSLRAVTDALAASHRPCAILLQACGHNPTGLDLPEGEWHRLSSFIEGTEHVVLLDMAYQGLAQGIIEDAAPVRIFTEAGVPLLVAWSASKNHSIYGLRAGLACAVAQDEAMQRELERCFMILTREVHSAASVPGQQIVRLVQEQYADAWREELSQLRSTLAEKRAMLKAALPAMAGALSGSGLYAILPLSVQQVRKLAERKVFLTEDGRVNIAGIPRARIGEFAEAVKTIL